MPLLAALASRPSCGCQRYYDASGGRRLRRERESSCLSTSFRGVRRGSLLLTLALLAFVLAGCQQETALREAASALKDSAERSASEHTSIGGRVERIVRRYLEATDRGEIASTSCAPLRGTTVECDVTLAPRTGGHCERRVVIRAKATGVVGDTTSVICVVSRP